MEHDVRLDSSHDRLRCRAGAHVGQDRLHVTAVASMLAGGEVPLEVPERPFVVVHEGQGPRTELEHLACELAADRTGATGDQDAGSIDRAGDGIGVDVDRLAAEQVLHAHVADAVNAGAGGH